MKPLEQLNEIIRKKAKELGYIPQVLYLPIDLFTELFLSDDLYYIPSSGNYAYKGIVIHVEN